MAKITRYTGNLLAFGANSTGTNRTVFGDVVQSDTLDGNITADYYTGWEIVGVNENPTKQDFNGLGFTQGQLLAYLHQVGVAEWDSLQEYNIGSITNVAGVLYESETNSNIGNDPTADAVNWTRMETRPGLLTEFTVTGAAAASIDFTGLDINTHKSYRIELEHINPLGAIAYVSLYANGDTTATNYYSQSITDADTVVSGALQNNARIAGTQTGSSGIYEILVARTNNRYRALSRGMNGDNTTLRGDDRKVYSPTVLTNITQLTWATSTGGFGVGTTVRIYRGDI